MCAELLPDFATNLHQGHPAASSTSFLLGGRRAVATGAFDTGVQQLWLDGTRVLKSLRVHGVHAESMSETPISIERVLRGNGLHLIERAFVPSEAPLCIIEWRVLESGGAMIVSWQTPHASVPAQAASIIMLDGSAEALFDRAPNSAEFTLAVAEPNDQRVTARLAVSAADVIRLVVRNVAWSPADPAVLARARLGAAVRAADEQIAVRMPDASATAEFRCAQSRLPSLIATSAALAAANALLSCGDPGAARDLLRDPHRYSLHADDAAALSARYLRWTGATGLSRTLAANARTATAPTSRPDGIVPATERAEAFVACVNGFMDGVLRIEPDAPRLRLTLRPRLPPAWDSLKVERIRMGDALVSFRYERAGQEHCVKVEQTAGAMPATLILEMALQANALAGASVDGHTAVLDARLHRERLHVPVQLVLDAPRELRLITRGGTP
jgi:hypothetical protein